MDGVQRHARSGINVVVVGAGIGGMMAALECWRKGHEVVIIERAEGHVSVGDIVAIMPSGLATLQCYPRMVKAFNDAVLKGHLQMRLCSGEMLFTSGQEWDSYQNATPGGLGNGGAVSRSSLLQILADQIAALKIPISFGRTVAGYAEDETRRQAFVTTENGETFSGDVVVAADGVGTKSYTVVKDSQARAQSVGQAVSRVAFHPRNIAPGSAASELLPKPGDEDMFRLYLGHQKHLVTWASSADCGFALTHNVDPEAPPGWRQEIKPGAILKMMEGKHAWDEQILDLIRQTPEDVKVIDWPLVFRDPHSTWTSRGGHIVQIGDAAHTFLPTSGNGATQALEDGLSLAECLRLGGRARIPLATRVHTKLRYQRVNIIQRTGFANRQKWHEIDPDKIMDDPRQLLGLAMRLGRWMWGHSPEKYAADMFAKARAHLETGAPFQNTNLPPGHVFEEWTVDQELAREKAGIPSTIHRNGDWSVKARI